MHGTDTAQTISAPELAKILGINERSVRRRSERENWKFVQGPRKVKLYYIDSLPEDVQVRVMLHRAEQINEKMEKSSSNGWPVVINVNFNIYISEKK